MHCIPPSVKSNELPHDESIRPVNFLTGLNEWIAKVQDHKVSLVPPGPDPCRTESDFWRVSQAAHVEVQDIARYRKGHVQVNYLIDV